MFRRVLLTAAFVFSFIIITYGDVSIEQIEGLSDAQKYILQTTVNSVITAKEKGQVKKSYSSVIDGDLGELSLDELYEIRDYLSGKSDALSDVDEDHIEIIPYDSRIESEDRAKFLIYSTISDAGSELGYIVQNNNPEISFDVEEQKVSSAHVYLTYYADCTKEQAADTLKKNTDELLYVICNTYPELSFEIIDFCWEVPALDEGNLYAARFWCEKEDGELTFGNGTGIIYEQ